VAHIRVDDQGFAWLPHDDFLAHFAPDVDPAEANIMFAVQQPLTMSAFDDVMGTPAWKNLPSWFAVAQHDEVIPTASVCLHSGWGRPWWSSTRATS
jgi:hypothetical protein